MNRRTPLQDPIRKSLRASVFDASAFSVMVGLGETYLPAFVLAIGLGEVVAGLVATVPMLCGAILQLISPHVVRHTGSHRRWVILCATFQGLAFVPLVIAAWRGWMPAWSALAISTVYWGTALAAGPAWNTWMSHIVPPRLRASFFSRRTRFAQAFVMIGLVSGGIVLHYAKTGGTPLAGFVFVFSIACAARLVSVYFLLRQVEPAVEDIVERRVHLVEVLDRFRRPAGALMLYMVAMQVTSQIAAPYFTPFMLKKLDFSYATFVAMMAVSFFAKSVSVVLFGRVAQKYGAITLLWIGGLGIVPLAVMWVVSGSPYYLLPTQLLAGACWGAYELATFLLLFETIRDDERTSVLTTFNLVNSSAIVAGAMLGGALLRWQGESYTAYLILFTVSSIGRAATVFLLRRVTVALDRPVPLMIRNLTVRPSGGSVDRPILTSIDDPDVHERLSRSQILLLSKSHDGISASTKANDR